MAHHPHDVVSAIGMSPNFAQDKTLFVAVRGSLNLFLVSRDGGFTWSESSSGLRGSRFVAIELASDWATSGVAWVAMQDAGIQMTADYGRTWNPPAIKRYVRGLAVAPTDPEGRTALFFSTKSEVYRSNDRGLTDMKLAVPVAGASIEAIGVPTTFWTEQNVAVATSDNRLLVSVDGGESWRSTVTSHAVRHIAFSPDFAEDRLLWISTWGGGVQRSEDAGRTFR
ncbi:MAG: hypothetical protein O7G83_00725, partial [Proteobacteria bacterium]|nr:hypothetical protein [Pseudomonadota bacterium]